MRTLHLDAHVDTDVTTAVELLSSGRLVAVPTETVYGLAADASNEKAVRGIFAAKGRPQTHPLIVHTEDVAHARVLSRDWTPAAEVLARDCWPGPLSILTEKSAIVPRVVTGGRDTVVLRVPDHPATLRILHALHEHGSIGIAAPSANKFGSISPTTAGHVVADLDTRIDAVLDGGPCHVGIESTIVDCTHEPAVILRPGGISIETIAASLAEHGLSVVLSDDIAEAIDTAGAIAPGMLRSHYAPRTPLLVFETQPELDAARQAAEGEGKRVSVVPYDDDTYEYSRHLYSSLHRCDDDAADLILARLPGSSGLGAAVRDRLIKAAAKR